MSVAKPPPRGSGEDKGGPGPAEARREEILEAALEVISRQGFHQTTIAAIANRAHVSRATVYKNFADKRDILVALADRITRSLIAAIDRWPALPSPAPADSEEEIGSTRDQLRIVIETRTGQILEAIAENADAARLVVRLTRSNDRLVDDILRRIDDHVVDVLSRDIDAAIGFGWARSCDTRTIVRFLVGGLEKLVLDALDRDDPLELDRKGIESEIGALVFFGLAQRDVALANLPQA